MGYTKKKIAPDRAAKKIICDERVDDERNADHAREIVVKTIFVA